MRLLDVLGSQGIVVRRTATIFFRTADILFTIPYFSVGFSRLVHFERTSAILVCKSERDLGRVSKLLRGVGVGRRRENRDISHSSPTQRTLASPPSPPPPPPPTSVVKALSLGCARLFKPR